MSDNFDFLVTFSGEADGGNAINNVYVVSDKGEVKTKNYLPIGTTYREFRGMAYGPDGDFYVAQAYKGNSAILQFSGVGSGAVTYVGQFVTPASSQGFLHPYQPVFHGGNLFVSSQDTNVVTAFYGPGSQAGAPGAAMPLPSHLTKKYPSGVFYPGTFVPAYQAEKGIPPNTSVPPEDGGLSFSTSDDSSTSVGGKQKTHSVRGLAFDAAGYLYVADEANNRVAVFAAEGAFVGAVTNSKDHSLSGPVTLCFDASARLLYIASPGDGRLYSYDTSCVAQGDFTANSLLQDPDLEKASGIIVGPDNSLYTGDRKSNKIHKWSSDFKSHSTFATFSDSPEQIVLAVSAS
jgi:hypothetical protein